MHPAVDEAAVDLDEAIRDLTQQLEETASDTGAVTALVDSCLLYTSPSPRDRG